MGERRVEDLEAVGETPPSAPEPAEKAPAVEVVPAVEFHYPDPTPLALVLKDVARWSGLNVVMEPSANVKIQVFAPRRLAPRQAWELFLASLSVVNLRAVQVGTVVKIVPVVGVVAA